MADATGTNCAAIFDSAGALVVSGAGNVAGCRWAADFAGAGIIWKTLRAAAATFLTISAGVAIFITDRRGAAAPLIGKITLAFAIGVAVF